MREPSRDGKGGWTGQEADQHSQCQGTGPVAPGQDVLCGEGGVPGRQEDTVDCCPGGENEKLKRGLVAREGPRKEHS